MRYRGRMKKIIWGKLFFVGNMVETVERFRKNHDVDDKLNEMIN